MGAYTSKAPLKFSEIILVATPGKASSNTVSVQEEIAAEPACAVLKYKCRQDR